MACAAACAALVLLTGCPLSVVNVGAPAVNCVFDASCTVSVNDTVGTIPVPGIAGTARLQSRTYTGSAGAPAAGKTAYVYRLDLTDAAGILNIPCVSALKVDFGPVSKLDYNTDGSADGVFVVTTGGLGTVGLASADKTGNVVTFTLSRPVCAGSSPGRGETSYFFGLAAATPPQAITAQVQVSGGGLLDVPARAPTH
jgi:hypothetical protein